MNNPYTAQFIQLIQEHPDLPVIFLVDGDVVADTGSVRWLGDLGSSRVDKLAVYKGKTYGSDERAELMDDFYYDHEDDYASWTGEKQEDIDTDIARRTEDLWKDCILVNIDTPDSLVSWADV